MPSYRIHEEHAEDSLESRALQQAIDDHNVEVTQVTDFGPVVLCLRDESGRLCGGLTGAIWAGWLSIKVLWLEEAARDLGHGSELLRAAEAFAYARGARHAHLTSFSFQAPEFYVRHGYEVFAQLSDYPTGHTQVFLRKELKASPQPTISSSSERP